MFTPPAGDVRTAASGLAEALERYDRNLSVLVARGYDPDLYSRMSRQFDEMRVFAVALPTVSAAWVTLLVSRVDLTHSLYLAHNGNASTVERQFSAHTAAVAALKQQCSGLMQD